MASTGLLILSAGNRSPHQVFIVHLTETTVHR